MNCLTPFKLKPRDAYAVMAFDKTTVNWQQYICDRRGDRSAYKTFTQFYYANPEAGKVAKPSGYGTHSRKSQNGWKIERPKRTFEDAKAEAYQGEKISDTIGVNVVNLAPANQ
jgi:hypothetical protein